MHTFQKKILLVMVLYCVLVIPEVISGPHPDSSSFAMNSGEDGVVQVSCNGKTYTGKGIAACTSSAALSDGSGYLVLGAMTSWLIRNYLVSKF